MAGLPKKIDFLARMPPSVSATGSSSPLSPPPYIGNFWCINGSQLVLEPQRFSPDSIGWYGGIEEIGDPLSKEDYVGSQTVGSQLGIEFQLPFNMSTAPNDNTLLILAEYVNAIDASLDIFAEYFDLADNIWHEIFSVNQPLTDTYVFPILDGVLNSLPTSPSITKLRIVLIVATLDQDTSVSSSAEIRLTHLTIPYCSLGIIDHPPPLLPPLTEPPSQPDIPGTLPPFIEVEPPLPPLPPPPPLPTLPPLPPGAEILRPNRDILVRLWQPRPAFMQLNDPLDPDSPIDAAVPLYGPATIDTFDELTGNYTGTIRPRVEVGFTAPVTEGPWDALQLRFRAARSRPPQPEQVEPPLPIPATKEPVTYPCPPDQKLIPRATDFPGVWQIPPLEQELATSVDDAIKDTSKIKCFITAPVTVPRGAPGQIALTQSSVPWDAGYNQIKVRLVTRARPNKAGSTDNKLTNAKAYQLIFSQSHAQLPEGTQEYSVTWNPFGCDGQLLMYNFSPTELRGTAVLSTTIDIHAEFFLAAADTDINGVPLNIDVQISTDGVNYYDALLFDLAAFQSTVIYYRIAINGDPEKTPTPLGKFAIGAGLLITGPEVVTGFDIFTYPQDNPPFLIQVTQIINSFAPLVSQCRIGVSLQGNMDLMQSLIQHTDILVSDWLEYVLTWDGFWSATNIKDLRIRLSAEALLLGDDVPFIDISAMDVIISSYCPGLSQPIAQPLIKLNQVDVIPMSDVSWTGWDPIPAWIMLVGDPTLSSDNDVLADPRTDNQLLVEMAEPVELPIVMPGYAREWIAVEAIIQARIVTWSSLSANLLVSTNFGQEQWTPALAQSQAMYFVTWNYNPGLTTDQISRLKIALIANSLDGDDQVVDPVEVAVSALTARLTFQDTLITPLAPLPPPLPPIVDPLINVIESDPEIFSCGSLGDCDAPQGKIVAKVTVTNPDMANATVNFVVGGRANIRISDVSGTAYSLSQTIGTTPVTFFIYGWIGDIYDPFPVDPTDGGVIINLVYSAGVHQVSVPWYYIGL